jgi:hypothetical protein
MHNLDNKKNTITPMSMSLDKGIVQLFLYEWIDIRELIESKRASSLLPVHCLMVLWFHKIILGLFVITIFTGFLTFLKYDSCKIIIQILVILAIAANALFNCVLLLNLAS